MSSCPRVGRRNRLCKVQLPGAQGSTWAALPPRSAAPTQAPPPHACALQRVVGGDLLRLEEAAASLPKTTTRCHSSPTSDKVRGRDQLPLLLKSLWEVGQLALMGDGQPLAGPRPTWESPARRPRKLRGWPRAAEERQHCAGCRGDIWVDEGERPISIAFPLVQSVPTGENAVLCGDLRHCPVAGLGLTRSR